MIHKEGRDCNDGIKNLWLRRLTRVWHFTLFPFSDFLNASVHFHVFILFYQTVLLKVNFFSTSTNWQKTNVFHFFGNCLIWKMIIFKNKNKECGNYWRFVLSRKSTAWSEFVNIWREVASLPAGVITLCDSRCRKSHPARGGRVALRASFRQLRLFSRLLKTLREKAPWKMVKRRAPICLSPSKRARFISCGNNGKSVFSVYKLFYSNIYLN